MLIRGGTTSVGLAAAAIAKSHGAIVASTTRNSSREKLLRESAVDQVFIDTGSIAEQVKEVCAGGVDKLLELVRTTTLKDSLLCTKKGGIVCMTGIVGNKWWFDNDWADHHSSAAMYLRSNGMLPPTAQPKK